VGVLRIGVPLLGLVILVALLIQIYVSSLGDSFSIGQVSVTPDTISVEAPEYSGILGNGTTYSVSAATAKASPTATNLISLTEAGLTMTKVDGVMINVNAQFAVLDTNNETVTIKDLAYVEDSTGTTGVVVDSVFDYASQSLVGQGPVSIQYADGTTLDAVGMAYDLEQANWTFNQADVTLPETPGSQAPGNPTP
jgi:hypothetical protein